MSNEHPVYITICDVDSNLCGWDCMFRRSASEYDCNLFAMDLDDNTQYTDQDDEPLKERCTQCLINF
jgi:hypothetical protein